MPAHRQLFRPADGISIRDPLSNEREKGNIMNPRRFAEFGGLHSGSARGVSDTTAIIRTPESTQRRVPVK